MRAIAVGSWKIRRLGAGAVGCFVAVLSGQGCGSSSRPGDYNGGSGGGITMGSSGGSGAGIIPGSSLPPEDSGGPGPLVVDASLADGATTTLGDPRTCDEAAQAHTYVGCDYWPTVLANNVWSIFDFAVVVANAGVDPADVTITGPSNTNATATVPPGQLAKIYLPWVPALKGPDSDNCGAAMPFATSTLATKAAFHLVASVPVIVYQFNALEYQGKGGPAGKNWSACPGNTVCSDPTVLMAIGCFSFSNDASLLLPSTAMTGNYRVAGHEGIVLIDTASNRMSPIGGTVTVTGTRDGTTVNIKVSSTGVVAAGGGIAATNPGGMLTFALNAGDVAELAVPGAADLSGSVVQASAPVQVITGHPCIQIPPTQPACDHIEESVFPAETMGKDYLVVRPAGPNGTPVAHQIRIYGNVNGTNLTYNPSVPAGCPTTVNAGQVVECGTPACPTAFAVPATMANCGITSQDFEVKGDQPFEVGTFTLGAFAVDPNKTQGDPAESFATAVEQFRSKYVFLAPDDYTVSYVDVVAKAGTTMTLDNVSVAAAPQAIGTSLYVVYRLKLGSGQAGAHVLVASQPVGIQVVGYGSYTSYMYPGGLDLARIAPPPLLQ
jgi:IgGFc binding protein